MKTGESADTADDAARKGVRLGVDVGTVRVGVAMRDTHGVLATPVTTLARNTVDRSDLKALIALVEEHEVVEVVVGLPKTLRGSDGPAVTAARSYGDALAAAIAPVPVVYVDERLTTVSADRQLSEAGVRGKARRKVIDQVAATRILQNRLDNLAGGRGR
jgi:putative Holliday junction resolvase